MKSNILVSVITPVYNAQDYIVEAIENVLNQTYKNFEYIIIDDASTDATFSILQNYANKFPQIKLYRNKKNLYIAGNRNKALKYVNGKYVVWQDADDVSLPTRIEELVSFMETNPEVGICGSFLESFDESGTLDIREYFVNDVDIRKSIFRFSPVAQPAAIIRSECFTEFGNYDLKYPPAEDLDFSFRIGTKYKFANLPKVLLRYRQHPNSATYSKLQKQVKLTLEIRKKYSTGYGYKMTTLDKFSYFLTWCTIMLPSFLTVYLFKKGKLFLMKLY